MSFKLFVIYCALIGGLCSYFGWAIGLFIQSDGILRAALKGLCVGTLIGMGLTVLDSIWNSRNLITGIAHTLTAAVLAGFGGFLGGIIGEFLFNIHNSFLILGWTITGILIGVAISAFEIISSKSKTQARSFAIGKAIKCMIGGGIGGLIGGALFFAIQLLWVKVFGPGIFWTPPAIGFSILGLAIGLFIGLAQVLIKEAWLRIENGRWQGKEIILANPFSTIGRKEGCEVAIFGDRNIQLEHACIRKSNAGFFLKDLNSPDGTFLNRKIIKEETLLTSEDLIQTGGTRLKFLEKTRKSI